MYQMSLLISYVARRFSLLYAARISRHSFRLIAQ
jgi:hypothetical protein